MTKRILGFIIAIISAIAIIASTAKAAETWYVGCDGLNCRTAPAGDVITVYLHGTELSVIGTDGGDWWEVYDGTNQGWVHKDYMVSDPNMTYLGVFYSTVYTPDPAENGGYDMDCYERKLLPQVGELVAVDPSVIPHHRTIYIEGVGYRRTGDSGVHGQHIDILQYGEWIEGFYIECDNRTFIAPVPTECDTCKYKENGYFIGQFLEVVPETVGQYTGLTDKNGKKIFEGDIVIDKYPNEKFGCIGYVCYNTGKTDFEIHNPKQPDIWINLGSRQDSVRVLGNIYDNPELLEREV